MRFFRRRRGQQAQAIDEAAAYAHSYGDHSADVRIIRLPPRRPRDEKVLETGETLRRAFVDRMERRGRDADPGLDE
jgi:hypothetical protein